MYFLYVYFLVKLEILVLLSFVFLCPFKTMKKKTFEKTVIMWWFFFFSFFLTDMTWRWFWFPDFNFSSAEVFVNQCENIVLCPCAEKREHEHLFVFIPLFCRSTLSKLFTLCSHTQTLPENLCSKPRLAHGTKCCWITTISTAPLLKDHFFKKFFQIFKIKLNDLLFWKHLNL